MAQQALSYLAAVRACRAAVVLQKRQQLEQQQKAKKQRWKQRL